MVRLLPYVIVHDYAGPMVVPPGMAWTDALRHFGTAISCVRRRGAPECLMGAVLTARLHAGETAGGDRLGRVRMLESVFRVSPDSGALVAVRLNSADRMAAFLAAIVRDYERGREAAGDFRLEHPDYAVAGVSP